MNREGGGKGERWGRGKERGREGRSGIVRGHLGLEPHTGRSNCTPVTCGVRSAMRGTDTPLTDTLKHRNTQTVTLTFTGCVNHLHGSTATPKFVPCSDVDKVGGVGGQSNTGVLCLVLSHILSKGIPLGFPQAGYSVASQRSNRAGGRSPLQLDLVSKR